MESGQGDIPSQIFDCILDQVETQTGFHTRISQFPDILHIIDKSRRRSYSYRQQQTTGIFNVKISVKHHQAVQESKIHSHIIRKGCLPLQTRITVSGQTNSEISVIFPAKIIQISCQRLGRWKISCPRTSHRSPQLQCVFLMSMPKRLIVHVPGYPQWPERSKTRITSEFTGTVRTKRKVQEVTIAVPIIYISKKSYQSRFIIGSLRTGIFLKSIGCTDKNHVRIDKPDSGKRLTFRLRLHDIASDPDIQHVFIYRLIISQCQITVKPVTPGIYQIITPLLFRIRFCTVIQWFRRFKQIPPVKLPGITETPL